MITAKTARRVGIAALTSFLLAFPFVAPEFFVVQIGIQSLFLGIVGLSLTFLAGYGGLTSLAQTALYGVSGYTLAITTVTHGWDWWLAVPLALIVTGLIAFIFALVSVRTQGIYFLMITLAMAMLVYYFADQDRLITGGHAGINGVRPPDIGGFSLRDPTTFYFVALTIAVGAYLGLRYLIKTPFGLTLQALRDNPRRLQSLGYFVEFHRVAAFTLAGVVAGLGGILGAWYNGAISPGAIDLTRTINVLVLAVLGGLVYLEGAFVGAVFFTLVTNFASSFTDRYNTVIGLTFLLVALFLPQGLVGLIHKLNERFGTHLWRPEPQAATQTTANAGAGFNSATQERLPIVVAANFKDEEK
jgi:branched-chain amino acid transport system permease protein